MTQIAKRQDKKDFSQQVYFKNEPLFRKYTWADTKVKFSTQLNYADLIQPERGEHCQVTEYLKIQLLSQTGNKDILDFRGWCQDVKRCLF